MKDTTFWPNEAQLRRLATSYKPNKAKNGLEKTKILQLGYPLNDRQNRFSFPAGGLFSTAQDLTRFAQMIMNKGVLDGRRYLSEESVKIMTSKQTPATLPDKYGLGWGVGDALCEHGGAFGTHFTVDWKNGIITVWLVQNQSFFGDGAKAQEAFRSFAVSKFGAK